MRRRLAMSALLAVLAGTVTAVSASATAHPALSVTGTRTAAVDVTMPVAFTLSAFARTTTSAPYAGLAIEDLRHHGLAAVTIMVRSRGETLTLGFAHTHFAAGSYRFILLAKSWTNLRFSLSGPTSSISLRPTRPTASQAGYRAPLPDRLLPAGVAGVPLTIGTHPLFALAIGFSTAFGAGVQYGDICITHMPVCEADSSQQRGHVWLPFELGPCYCGVIYVKEYQNPATLQPGRNRAVLDTANTGLSTEFTFFATVIQ